MSGVSFGVERTVAESLRSGILYQTIGAVHGITLCTARLSRHEIEWMIANVKLFWIVVLSGLFASSAQGQRSAITLGGGYGATFGGKNTAGSGIHVQAGMPLAHRTETLYLKGELLYQQGTATGSPFSCEQVRSRDCFGRSDENRLVILDVHAVWEFAEWGQLRPYLTPLGIGVYYRSTDSSETEGPTEDCLVDGRFVDCPNALPFRTYTKHIATVGVGINNGVGLAFQAANVRLFVEARVHRLWDREGGAGAIPITLGIAF